METTAIVGAIAAVFAATTTYLFSSKGSPLWIGAACGALIALGVCWTLWRRVRSYLCVLRYRRLFRGNRYMNSVVLLGATSRALPQLTLGDVYVDVVLRDDETDSGGQKVYGWSPGRPGERAELDDFLRRGKGQQFAVYGMPGSGKSTLLRSTAVQMSRTRRPRAPMPILVVLAHHMNRIVEDPEVDLAEIAVSARWFNPDAIPVHEVRRWLAKGRCVIMLDGLDEVPEQHRPAVMLWAEQQHGGYKDCSLVVTSREPGFESAKFDAADLVLEVCPLTRDQIDLFVENCYRAFRKGGEVNEPYATAEEAELLAGLRADPALYDLASTPLLLQLMVFVHRNSDDGLPASRGELYERMVPMLLHERRNRVKTAAPADPLELRPKLRVVQRLALELMLQESVQFDPLPLVKELVEEFEVEVSAQELLRDLRENGLLSRLSPDSDTYMFVHLSFQEYLAAKELHEQGRAEALTGRIDQRWWRNTALFWATAYDPDPLIEACANAGTAEGWSLALELRHEVERSGGEVDSRLTDRIDAFLSEEHPVDSEEYRIACTEVIGRSLREVDFVNGRAICVEPVNRDVYELFARSERARGLHPSAHRFGPRGELMGLWPGEVSALLDWLSRFDHHGFGYRLTGDGEFGLHVAASVVGRRTALDAGWVASRGQVRPRSFLRDQGLGFEVPAQQLLDCIRTDWRFMMSRFDLAGRSDEARLAAAQIRSACAALKKIADSYKAALSRLAVPRDRGSVMARTITSHRSYADTFAKTVEDLVWFADSESINLLAVIRLANSHRPPPGQGRLEGAAIPTAAVKDQFDRLLEAVRSAVQASYRLHRDCYREDGGSPGFLKTAGALLLASRLPAQGSPSTFKLPNRLSEAVRTFKPALPQELPGLVDEIRREYGLRSKPHRFRPRKQLDDMLSEMRRPLLELVTRQAEVDLETLASMRIALCAVAIWGEAEHSDLLWSCITGLAAIESRHRGTIDMNEVILLVREDLTSSGPTAPSTAGEEAHGESQP